MHVRKAYDELLKLLDIAPANLDVLTKAAVLFDGMERSNMDTAEGERPNRIVNEKLHSARHWFEILCGVGEEGNWTEAALHQYIRGDLLTVNGHMTPDGRHFQRWP